MLTIEHLTKKIENEIHLKQTNSKKKRRTSELNFEQLSILYNGYRDITEILENQHDEKLAIIDKWFQKLSKQGLNLENEDILTINKKLNDFLISIGKEINNLTIISNSLNIRQDDLNKIVKSFNQKFRELKNISRKYQAKIDLNQPVDLIEFRKNINEASSNFEKNWEKIQAAIVDDNVANLKYLQEWLLNLAPEKMRTKFATLKREANNERIENEKQQKNHFEATKLDVWLRSKSAISDKKAQLIASIADEVKSEIKKNANTKLVTQYNERVAKLNSEYPFWNHTVELDNEKVESAEELEQRYSKKSNLLLANFFRKIISFDGLDMESMTTSHWERLDFVNAYQKLKKQHDFNDSVQELVKYIKNKLKNQVQSSDEEIITSFVQTIVNHYNDIKKEFDIYEKELDEIIEDEKTIDAQTEKEKSLIRANFDRERKTVMDFMKVQEYNQSILQLIRDDESHAVNSEQILAIKTEMDRLQIFIHNPDFKEYNEKILELRKQLLINEQKMENINEELVEKTRSKNSLKQQQKKLATEIAKIQHQINSHEAKKEINLFKKYPNFIEYESQINAISAIKEDSLYNIPSSNLQLVNQKEMEINNLKLKIAEHEKLNKNNIDKLQVIFQKTPALRKYIKNEIKNHKTLASDKLNNINLALAHEKRAFTFSTKVKKIFTFGFYKTNNEKKLLKQKKEEITRLVKNKIQIKFDNWFDGKDENFIKNEQILKDKQNIQTNLSNNNSNLKILELLISELSNLERTSRKQDDYLSVKKEKLENLNFFFQKKHIDPLLEQEELEIKNLYDSKSKTSADFNALRKEKLARLEDAVIYQNGAFNENEKKIFAYLKNKIENNILNRIIDSALLIIKYNESKQNIDQEEITNIINLIQKTFQFFHDKKLEQANKVNVIRADLDTLHRKTKAHYERYMELSNALKQKVIANKACEAWIDNQITIMNEVFECQIENNHEVEIDYPIILNLLEVFKEIVREEILTTLKNVDDQPSPRQSDNNTAPKISKSDVIYHRQCEKDYIFNEQFNKLYDEAKIEHKNNEKHYEARMEVDLFKKFFDPFIEKNKKLLDKQKSLTSILNATTQDKKVIIKECVSDQGWQWQEILLVNSESKELVADESSLLENKDVSNQATVSSLVENNFAGPAQISVFS